MRKAIWVLLFAVLVLVACQAQPVIPPEPTQVQTQPDPVGSLTEPYPLPGAEGQPSIDPNQPYPPPLPPPSIPFGMGEYPEPGEEPGFYTVNWERAVESVMKGEVNIIQETFTTDVYFELGDGRVFKAIAPEDDSVSALLERCGDVCADVTVRE
jgi:hypothetical protein